MHNSASLRGQAARLFDYLQSRTEPVDSNEIRRDLVIVNISKLATSINAHLASQGVPDRVVCLHRGRLPAWWSLMRPVVLDAAIRRTLASRESRVKP